MKRKKMPKPMVTIEEIAHNGTIVISTMVNKNRLTRSFIGYTKNEAIRLFIKELEQRRMELVMKVNDLTTAKS